MSLAQELFADLDEDVVDEEDIKMESDVKNEAADQDEEVPVQLLHMGMYERITDVAKLTKSKQYLELIAALQEFNKLPEIPKLTNPLDCDEQYLLVVKLSELASDIDNEVSVIHKFVRDKYEKRFPELESLVPMPFDYIRVVKTLGNEVDTKGQNKQLLGSILPPATCIVVSVMSSTTQGKRLEADELHVINEACDMAEELCEEKWTCTDLWSKGWPLLRRISPELWAQELQQCSFHKQEKKTLSGFSTASLKRHSGFVFYHPIVQTLPPSFRDKAAKIVASKCTLAARIDYLHSSQDGSMGEKLAVEVQEKLQKMTGPPPVKMDKALPRPIDKASKKRGGRRARATKKRFGVTELSKKKNRMNFGELQEDIMQDNIGFTLGQAKSNLGI